MKKLTLAFFLLITAGFSCYSQSLTLSGDHGPLPNGAQVTQSGPSDTLQLITWLHIKNNSGNTLQVMMKKEEIALVPGTNSSLCWGGYCYGPEMTVSTFPLEMPPGDTLSGCFAHYGPNGSRGVSTIRWTFFDESNPSDSISLTVQYSTYPLATGGIQGLQEIMFKAGPVPASGQVVATHALPAGMQGRVNLLNSSGKLVSGSGPVTHSGTVIFQVSGLPPGVYYASLLIDGRPVATRKIPVHH